MTSHAASHSHHELLGLGSGKPELGRTPRQPMRRATVRADAGILLDRDGEVCTVLYITSNQRQRSGSGSIAYLLSLRVPLSLDLTTTKQRAFHFSGSLVISTSQLQLGGETEAKSSGGCLSGCGISGCERDRMAASMSNAGSGGTSLSPFTPAGGSWMDTKCRR